LHIAGIDGTEVDADATLVAAPLPTKWTPLSLESQPCPLKTACKHPFSSLSPFSLNKLLQLETMNNKFSVRMQL
jgi:hypothetical protein